jgi:hypothetical protein
MKMIERLIEPPVLMKRINDESKKTKKIQRSEWEE